jgi:hypothetical protein
MSTGSNKGFGYSRLLRIAGDNRTPGGGKDRSTNFVVNTGQNIQRVSKISVSSVTFPNNFDNVQAFNPDYSVYTEAEFTLRVASTGTQQSSTVPGGRYTDVQLAYLVQAKLKTMYDNLTASLIPAGNSTFQFTRDPNNFRWTISFYDANRGDTVYFADASVPTVQQSLGQMGAIQISSPFEKLGFAPWPLASITSLLNNSITTTGGGSTNVGNLKAPYLPKLLGLTKIYVRSARLGPGNCYDEEGKVSNCIIPVVVNSAYGQLNFFETKVDNLTEITYPRPIEFNNIDIQLTDRNGNEVNLYGGNVQIEFRIWFSQF